MNRAEFEELMNRPPDQGWSAREIERLRHVHYMLEIMPDYLDTHQESEPPTTIDVTPAGGRVVERIRVS